MTTETLDTMHGPSAQTSWTLTPERPRAASRDLILLNRAAVWARWHPARPTGINFTCETNDTGTVRMLAIGRLLIGVGSGIPTP